MTRQRGGGGDGGGGKVGGVGDPHRKVMMTAVTTGETGRRRISKKEY